VAVDTTVMEKAIAYPTDARLYERARAQLVVLAQEAGVDLRQTYARPAPQCRSAAMPMPSSSDAQGI
jgi:IS5 family transposase